MERFVKMIVECEVNPVTEALFKTLCRVKYSLPDLGCYVVEVPEGEYGQLARITGVRAVHSEARITAQMDRAAVEVKARDAEGRPPYGATGAGIGVAVLDTGVDAVEDLRGGDRGLTVFKDFINDREEPYDDNGHGTQEPWRRS